MTDTIRKFLESKLKTANIFNSSPYSVMFRVADNHIIKFIFEEETSKKDLISQAKKILKSTTSLTPLDLGLKYEFGQPILINEDNNLLLQKIAEGVNLPKNLEDRISLLSSVTKKGWEDFFDKLRDLKENACMPDFSNSGNTLIKTLDNAKVNLIDIYHSSYSQESFSTTQYYNKISSFFENVFPEISEQLDDSKKKNLLKIFEDIINSGIESKYRFNDISEIGAVYQKLGSAEKFKLEIKPKIEESNEKIHPAQMKPSGEIFLRDEAIPLVKNKEVLLEFIR